MENNTDNQTWETKEEFIDTTAEVMGESMQENQQERKEERYQTGPDTGNAEFYNYGQNRANGYQYNQFNYQSAPQQHNQLDNTPLSLGDWVITLLVAMVPCVGIIIYCVWAFSSSGNVNRRNYCRAALIIQAISIVLAFIFGFFTVLLSVVSYY